MSTPIFDVLKLQLQTRRTFPEVKGELETETDPQDDTTALALELRTCALFADGTRQGELVPLADFMRRRMARALRSAATALDAAALPEWERSEHDDESDVLVVHEA